MASFLSPVVADKMIHFSLKPRHHVCRTFLLPYLYASLVFSCLILKKQRYFLPQSIAAGPSHPPPAAALPAKRSGGWLFPLKSRGSRGDQDPSTDKV